MRSGDKAVVNQRWLVLVKTIGRRGELRSNVNLLLLTVKADLTQLHP